MVFLDHRDRRIAGTSNIVYNIQVHHIEVRVRERFVEAKAPLSYLSVVMHTHDQLMLRGERAHPFSRFIRNLQRTASSTQNARHVESVIDLFIAPTGI